MGWERLDPGRARGRAVALRGRLQAARRADRGAARGGLPRLPLRRRRRALRPAGDDRAGRAPVDRAGVHAAGGVLDCHLMVDDPAHHFEEIAASGGDSVTFHVEATDDPAGVGGARARARARGRHRVQPGDEPAEAAAFAAAAGAELVLCMSIDPGLLGPGVHAGGARPRSPSSRALVDVPDPGRRRRRRGERAARPRGGRDLLVAGTAVFADADPAAAYRRIARRSSA